MGTSQRTHYCILRKEQENDGDVPGDLDYRKVKQQHFIKDLQQRYNIQTVLIDSYEQITQILHQVELLHKRHTVFVSGAADNYAPWDEAKALELCAEISATLIKSKY